eukprot:1384098-Lingulodinium_polyedra.AAC.1
MRSSGPAWESAPRPPGGFRPRAPPDGACGAAGTRGSLTTLRSRGAPRRGVRRAFGRAPRRRSDHCRR